MPDPTTETSVGSVEQSKPKPESTSSLAPSSSKGRLNFLSKIFHLQRGSHEENGNQIGVDRSHSVTGDVSRVRDAEVMFPGVSGANREALESRIVEAGEKGGLNVALEGRLEGWHTEINRWMIKTENIPDPRNFGEKLQKFGRENLDPSREYLRVADMAITSLRLALGGPYSKGGDK